MKSTSQRLFLLAGCLAGMIAQGDSIVTTHVVPAAETQTVAPAPAYTYYRFALRQQIGKANLKDSDSREYFQLAELALYDAAGNRINKNLTKSDSSSVAGMAAGTFYVHNGVKTTWDGVFSSAYKFFDDDKTTKGEGHVSHLAQDYPDYWALLDMRLANGSPAAVSYNLQSANDTYWNGNTNRCPSAWAILGSNNGTDWDVLDMIDEAEGVSIRTYAQYAWFNGGKPIPFRQNAKMQLLVQSNGKAVISADTALDTLLTYGGHAEFSSGTRSTFDIPEGDSMYFGGNVLGSGTIAKSGAGALSVGGLNGAFTGALAVNAGTVTVTRAQVTESAKFYRFAFKQFGSDSYAQIGELALYDTAGNRLNLDLQKFTGEVSAMTEGTVLVKASVGELQNGNWTNLFDGKPTTKLEGRPGAARASNSSTWTYVYMRLPSGSASVAGYNLATANDTDNYHSRNPVAWRLESSDDALNWKILDDRDFDYARITYANATWFNGGKMFPVHAECSRPMVYQSSRKYFRFTVTKRVNEGATGGMEFSEFALCDMQGNRVNLNLENKGNSQSAADLTPGSFTAVAIAGAYINAPDATESPTKLFDGNTATKGYFGAIDMAAGRKIALVMRLADSAAPVAGYCLAAGTDIQADNTKARNPVSWTLEDSVDGANWRLIAQEDDCPLISRTNKLWANGGLPIAITSGDTYDLPEQATLSVATGATLTLPAMFGEGYTKLAVDCIDAGTICNFKSATGMSLYLTNLKQCVKDANRRRTLPISFTGVTDLSTLSTWKVYVDGVQKPYYTLGVDGSHLTVSGDPGLFIVVE